MGKAGWSIPASLRDCMSNQSFQTASQNSFWIFL